MTITGTAASSTALSGHDDVVETLDLQLRELVRREGVDPQRDAAVVRRIAESRWCASTTSAASPGWSRRSPTSARW